MHKAIFKPESFKFRVKQVNIDPRLWGLVARVPLHATFIGKLPCRASSVPNFVGFAFSLALFIMLFSKGLF